MTVDEFVKKYTNVLIDTDGYFSGQCMDLMHAYCRDVLGLSDLSILAAADAKTVWTNFNNVKGHELFDKIPNTPTGVPQNGDIMFWNTTIGSAGHVAIFIDGDVNKFNSFDQNFPVGSLCHVQNHNYNGVLGWLRLKVPPTPPTTDLQKQLDEMRKQRDGNWDLYQVEIRKNTDLQGQIQPLKDKIAKATQVLNG